MRAFVRLALVTAVSAVTLPFADVCAQAPRVSARATVPSITVDEGAVVTTVFALRNLTTDSVALRSSLDLPKGWTNVTGLAPKSLAPSATDTWIAGIAVPANAVAARYFVRASIVVDGAVVRDSVVVIVGERRALEVLPIETPGWMVGGSSYEATFMVRNRGNVPSNVTLRGTTSRGSRVTTSPGSVVLTAGSSARVTVRVAMALKPARTTDDVIELTASISDDSVTAVASTHTTVVPDSRGGNSFETLPATLLLRSSSGAAGVAPIALMGAGRIGETHTTAEFLFQAPTNQDGPVGFGERDEYRLALKGDHYSVRLGDHLFGWTPLTASANIGTGAEARRSFGMVEGGAYAQRPRWSPSVLGEQGAFVAIGDSSIRGGATMLMRQPKAGGSVRIAGLNGQMKLGGATFDAEAAGSDSVGARDEAFRARVMGATKAINYEAGIVRGGDNFAGPFGGGSWTGGTVSAQLTKSLSIATSGRVSDWGVRPMGEAVYGEHVANASAALTYDNVGTLEYGWLARRASVSPEPNGGAQHGVRFTTSRQLGPITLAGGAEYGVVRETATNRQHDYTQGTISINADLGKRGSFGATSTVSNGSTLAGATDGVVDFGVNGRLRLPFGIEFGLAGSARRATLGVLDSSGAWFSVMDARLDRRFSNGAVIGLHGRTMQSPYTQSGSSNHAVYLEYRAPLRLPVMPSRQKGRAIGRVTNADDGSPVAGALVRLGLEAAVTDKNGRVYFSGLDAKQYRVALEATGAAAGAMLDGDVVIDMTNVASDKPREFALSVTRGARVAASVRTLERKGTAGAAAAELVDAGAASDVIVTLAGARDTVYQASDDAGRVDFGSVVPGTYILSVRTADAPGGMKFERDQIEVTVKPGDKSLMEFRLVPRERAIRIIDAGTVKNK